MFLVTINNSKKSANSQLQDMVISQRSEALCATRARLVAALRPAKD